LARHKTLIVLFVFLFVLMIAVIGGVVYFSGQSRQDPHRAGSGIQRDSGQPLRITGFQFDHDAEGKKVIRIRADELTVEKMKLGHFSIGIANVAKLKNGVIEVYGELARKPDPPGSGPASQADLNSGGGVSREPVLSFDNLFKEESLPSFGTKKVASIVIEPIRVQLRDQETVVVQITAASASLKLKNREIQFKGNVRLSANQHSLEAEEMSFHPENGRIKVEGDYLLQSNKDRIRGKRLETDVFLKETSFGSSKLKN
jgi:hypothetical protein